MPAPSDLQPAARIRLLIVDDHAIFRAGLRTLLAAQPDFTIAGEAVDGESAVTFLRDQAVDVVLLDVRMPGMGGVAAARAIHADRPELAIIGLSMDSDPPRQAEMREAGARAFVSKDAPAGEIVAAIRAVRPG